MPSSTATDPQAAPLEGRELEQAIEARGRSFDVTSLLLLLEEIGIDPAAVRRAGFPAPSPQPTWIDAVTFSGHHRRHGHRHPPSRGVSLSVNLGLQSCRSPLPAYFRGFATDPEVAEPLGELLALLDDQLLERRFAAYAPERDPGVFPAGAPGRSRWPEAQRDLLALTALRSPSALHWLFAKVFPELRVTVRRAPQSRWVETPEVRLGAAELGVAALGGPARLPVQGMEVVLIAGARLSHLPDPGGPRPWPGVVEERLSALIFPPLRETGLSLEVTLLILDEEAEAHLDRDREGLPSWVGVDPLRPDADIPQRVLIFAGPVPPA